MLKKLLILYFYLKTKYFNKYTNRLKLEKMQEKKLKKFLPKVKAKSKFYRNYDGIITKKEMMENFDDINTAGIKLEEAMEIAQEAEDNRNFKPKIKQYSVGLSSGTSGKRGLFLISEYEQAKWAGTVLAKLLPYSIFHPQKIAFFLRANNNLYESVKSSKINFRFFDLKKDSKENLRILNEYSPNIVAAPPNMLKIIAKAQKNGEININPVKIISVADVLYADVKKEIEETFSLTIHQVYQATEGFLGCTCKCGKLHLNEDLIKFEKKYIDKENHRFIPIITDFGRFTQPVINYELNDILVEDTTPCKCGSCFTVIKRIEGRCDDILYFKDLNGNTIEIFPDFLVRAVIRVKNAPSEFKIIQTAENILEIELDKDIAKQEIYEELIKLFEEKNIKINIIFKPFNIEKDLSLKQKRVICKWKK